MEFWRPITTDNNTFWKSRSGIQAGIDEDDASFKLNNVYLEPGV